MPGSLEKLQNGRVTQVMTNNWQAFALLFDPLIENKEIDCKNHYLKNLQTGLLKTLIEMSDKPEPIQDDLSFLLIGSVLHPDIQAREVLSSELEQWIGGLNKRYSQSQIADYLKSQKGTPLEPFILSKTDLEIVSKFLLVAFSEEFKCTRVLVRSSDKIGSGALLVTQRLNSHYLESYVHGKKIRMHKELWKFEANLAPKENFSGLGYFFKRKATIACTESGIEIKLRWPETGNSESLVRFKGSRTLEWPEQYSFRNESYFKSDKSLLSSCGVELFYSNDGIKIQTTSPESQIRLLARISRGEEIIIDETGSSFFACVRLTQPSENSSVLLSTNFFAKQNPIPWIRTTCTTICPVLSDQSRDILSDYLIPYNNWAHCHTQPITA